MQFAYMLLMNVTLLICSVCKSSINVMHIILVKCGCDELRLRLWDRVPMRYAVKKSGKWVWHHLFVVMFNVIHSTCYAVLALTFPVLTSRTLLI